MSSAQGFQHDLKSVAALVQHPSESHYNNFLQRPSLKTANKY